MYECRRSSVKDGSGGALARTALGLERPASFASRDASGIMRRAMATERLRGKFIVIDGGEGCGKSTQSQMLGVRLRGEGLNAVAVHDPGTTRIGLTIRQVLLNPENTDMSMRCEMLLYMAARAQMMRQIIAPALEGGAVVVSDRFISSTLAYQLGGDGLTAKEIRAVGDVAIDHRWPDLTIILDMPLERSSVRVDPQLMLTFKGSFKPRDNRDRIEQRSIEYHQQVRKNYLAQAKADPAHYRVVDADRDVQAVHEEIWRHVTKLAGKGGGRHE
jgi:dTMP kinase